MIFMDQSTETETDDEFLPWPVDQRWLKLLKCFKVLFYLVIKRKWRKRTRNETMGRDIEFAETSGQWTTRRCTEHTNGVRISVQTGKHILRNRRLRGNGSFIRDALYLKSWKDDLTENVVEILELPTWKKHLLKLSKCKMNSNDQNMQLTVDQRYLIKTDSC